jgi:hypothetical protein
LKNSGKENSVLFVLKFLLIFLLIHDGFFSTLQGQPDPVRDDTIPSPPGTPLNFIMGPDILCTGDTGTYTIDAPVGAFCEWALNGTIQNADDCTLELVWTETGLHTLVLTFNYTNGTSSVMDTLEVIVNDIPDNPAPITGDTTVCEYTIHTYYTTVGPYDSCEWKVNGELQSTFAPLLNYSFGASGTYVIEVKAYNNCGISEATALEVQADGAAPDPPGPIQGPATACEGNTYTYSTTVNPGESCEWSIDGEVQPDTTIAIDIAWEQRGNHQIEVRAVTDCGTGNPTSLNEYVSFIPEVDLGNDTSIYQGETLILDAGNPGAGYLWNTGATSQTLAVSTSGTYSVTVTTGCGDDSDEIDVGVIVGTGEITRPPFRYSTGGGLFKILGSQVAEKIELFDLHGRLLDVKMQGNTIEMPGKGVFVVRIQSGSYIYNLKVSAQ